MEKKQKIFLSYLFRRSTIFLSGLHRSLYTAELRQIKKINKQINECLGFKWLNTYKRKYVQPSMYDCFSLKILLLLFVFLRLTA